MQHVSVVEVYTYSMWLHCMCEDEVWGILCGSSVYGICVGEIWVGEYEVCEYSMWVRVKCMKCMKCMGAVVGCM